MNKLSMLLRKGLFEFDFRNKEHLFGLLFALPAILGFLIFVLGPMVASLILSFTDYAIVNKAKFVGFENYTILFTSDPFFYNSLGVTLYYICLSIPLNICAAFFVAIMLNQDIKCRGFLRLAYYLPTIVPVAATSVIWKWLFDPALGIINFFLMSFGLPTSKFLFDEATVLPSMAVMGVWQTGGTMLIFLAGLQGVPRQLYESVEVDGGRAWHKFLHITIPMMTPTIFFNVVMGFINGLQVFTQSYIITGGGPNNKSNFIVLQLFKEAFTYSRMSKACAIAWILFLIVCAVTVLNFKMSKLWVYYEGEG
jgi:multiple sugar transport system permease protein